MKHLPPYLISYAQENAAVYLTWANEIRPNLSDPRSLYKRLAFSILSAHTQLPNAAAALDYALECYDRGTAPQPGTLRQYGHTGTKAAWLYPAIIPPLKSETENWHAYRLRLRHIPGLGLCKASFLAALLYPLEAETCCIDTHLAAALNSAPTNGKGTPLRDYLTMERYLTKQCSKIGLPLFVFQWAVWDAIRGQAEPHAFLRD